MIKTDWFLQRFSQSFTFLSKQTSPHAYQLSKPVNYG